MYQDLPGTIELTAVVAHIINLYHPWDICLLNLESKVNDMQLNNNTYNNIMDIN